MRPRKIIQKRINTDGDVAGQIVKNVYPKTPLRERIESYKGEIASDSCKLEFIEELQDYMQRVPEKNRRDLEEKLVAADREDLVIKGKLLKEKFAKKLYRHTFSPGAQIIFVDILSIISSSFNQKVLPLIQEQKSKKEVDEEIFKSIIEYVYNQVGNSDLNINMEHIHGMIYYLTGNCYLEWE